MNASWKFHVALMAAMALPLASCSVGEPDTATIRGVFKDASPLEPGSEVRADGVLVGTVKSIELDRLKGNAIVSLEVQKNVLPVHQDARMIIKPINLLGENYLQLDPGSPKKSYLSSNSIAMSNTENAVTLQGLLDTFDDPTSAGLAALLLTSGEGLQGNGQNTADAIKALAPAMQDIDRLGDILRDQNDVLNSLIDQAAPVAASVAKDDGRDLDRMIAALTETLEATRDKQDALGKTIDELPSTLREAQQTFESLKVVSDELGPTLEKARPVTEDLREISDEIVDFSEDADPAFNGFDALFAAADKLLVEAAPVAKSLRADGSQLVDITHTVDYVSQELLDKHRRELMTFVRYWSLSTNSRDATSHYFRGVFHVTPQQILGLAGQVGLPTVDQSAAASAGSAPAKDGADDDVVSNLTGAVKDVTEGLTGDVLDTSQQTDDGATGLTTTQEEGLIGQLLGGLKR